ncbi:Sorting nexin-13, partial [Stegodyphus mimosarum]
MTFETYFNYLMASKIFWLLLVMILSISTFGFWICSILIISFMTSITGFVVTSYYEKNRRIYINFNSARQKPKRRPLPILGIPKVVSQMNSFPDCPKYDQRLTGSNEIDEPLQEIIIYILRDFIQSWYKSVSSNEDFLIDLNEMCRRMINNFSNNAKQVNWLSFFTQGVVEEFTSHLRLYRHAELIVKKKQKEKLNNPPSIESVFFDLETNAEGSICRENVCTSSESEIAYMRYISDVVLYLLLPPDDFNNRVLKQCLREVLLCSVLQPLISQFSDPDVINQNLIWMCKDHPLSSKSLLSVLRRTDNNEELNAFFQICKHELKVQNAKDTGDKDEMKKYMRSIMFVQNIARQRYDKLVGLSKVADTDFSEFYLERDCTDSPHLGNSAKLVSLPFDVILNNNIALHYFTQYLINIEAEGYVFLYHNIESFRTTVGLLAEDILPDQQSINEKLRDLALQIFDTHLGANATSRVNLDETLLRKLLSRLKTETITETCFDEVQEKVYEILENEFYLTGFKDSKQYVKLLAELDLLHDLNSSSDIDSLSSSKSEEEEKFNCDTVVPTDEEMLNELLSVEISPEDFDFPDISSGPLLEEAKEIGTLYAEVHSTGITHHAGRTFAVYAISVCHQRIDGPEEKWFVIRRYSEFYDFHELLVSKYPVLASYNFPPKKPFNNLSRQLMEKRRHMLNGFIQFLLSPEMLAVCDGLNLLVYNFLQPNVSENKKKSFIRSVVNPFKTSVKTVSQIVKMVPDTFFELKGGLVRNFFRNSEIDSCDVPDGKFLPFKDSRAEDIPFRIILLLMDEVFNLRNKDLWFRRRIMALLRQIIKTMQGGAINRKIKEYIRGLTSVTQIAEWLKILCASVWPDGVLAGPSPERDQNTKLRTCIAAKTLLFSAIPDELKHIIGYETSFKGAMLIFNMFQYPSLNRRLLFVLLENFLTVLFPENKMPELFEKLHLPSDRLKKVYTASVDKINRDQQTSQGITKVIETKPNEDFETKLNEVKEKPNVKVRKEPKNKLSFQCLSQQNSLPSPKPKRRKKSVEKAIFYTELPEKEDAVILPLSR